MQQPIISRTQIATVPSMDCLFGGKEDAGGGSPWIGTAIATANASFVCGLAWQGKSMDDSRRGPPSGCFGEGERETMDDDRRRMARRRLRRSDGGYRIQKRESRFFFDLTRRTNSSRSLRDMPFCGIRSCFARNSKVPVGIENAPVRVVGDSRTGSVSLKESCGSPTKSRVHSSFERNEMLYSVPYKGRTSKMLWVRSFWKESECNICTHRVKCRRTITGSVVDDCIVVFVFNMRVVRVQLLI